MSVFAAQRPDVQRLERSPRRRWARVAAVGLLIALLSPLDPASAQTDGPNVTFDAIASAYAFDSTISNPSIPIGLVIQGAGPTAQGQLTSFGQSQGFASFPYPGDTVVGLPGLASAAFLGGFPVPQYPLYTASNVGSDPQSVNAAGIVLESRSEQRRTQSSAVVGTGGSGGTATADVIYDADRGSVKAIAESSFDGIDLAGVAKFSGVESTATVELLPDGTITKDSSISVARLQIPALSLTLPDEIPVPGGLPVPIPGIPSPELPAFPPIPLPLGGITIDAPDIGFVDGEFVVQVGLLGERQSFAVPADIVLDALEAVGFEATFSEPIETETGIVSAAMTLKTTLPAPPENEFFNGPTDVAITLGRSTASIQGSVSPPTPIPSFDAAPPPVSAGGSGSFSGGSTPSDSGSFDAGGGSAAVAPTPSAGNGSATTGSELASGTPINNIDPLDSIFDIYLLFIVVGVIGTAAAQIVRYLGVRTSWTS